jgi:hypothetical protein
MSEAFLGSKLQLFAKLMTLAKNSQKKAFLMRQIGVYTKGGTYIRMPGTFNSQAAH